MTSRRSVLYYGIRRREEHSMFDINQLVGMTEESAIEQIKAAGLRARVRERNGQEFVIRMDARKDRGNLYFVGDKVYKVA